MRVQAIPARMSCDDDMECVAGSVPKEYTNLHNKHGLEENGDPGIHYVGDGPGRKFASDTVGCESPEASDDNDDEDKPTENAVCAFVADNLHKEGSIGTGKPLQQG